MGAIFSGRHKSQVLVVGLDNSGKSSVINFLKPAKDKVAETQATVGFQVENFRHGQTQFTMFDMSGQGRYRNLWEHYYQDAQAIIFVIDSADSVRMCVVEDELKALLAHKDIANKSIPMLFFANKIDLPDALDASEISKALQLERISDRPWTIVKSNALTGEGLHEGMKWLDEKLR
ncbi:ADP-ribosylation factor-like protein 6 [Plasmodiophora brassicae]|uniref:ADP-ribosylation factor-like protein 6 n=1 Tax=Plasmodiophora brassicae TaxID=37360 RepID=A0A0G4IXU6_PLABS|nr:hypothetical protein PBRA_007625 [Plasmodiophora brassicae]SPQ99525.1 unnamed protein product [Plasmodiophora brassicae]